MENQKGSENLFTPKAFESLILWVVKSFKIYFVKLRFIEFLCALSVFFEKNYNILAITNIPL